MQLFDILNPLLFKPLSGHNQVFIAELLLIIWARCKRSADFSLYKSELINLGEEYFTGLSMDIPLDDDFEETDTQQEEFLDCTHSKDPHVLTREFIFNLRRTGWLEELEGGYEEEPRIAIDHRVVPLLQALEAILNPKSVTYSGKLYKAYQLLKSIADEKNPYENVLQEISVDMDTLNNSLRQLNASIGNYLDKLTQNKTPQQVLELFNQYEEKIVIAAYHRFKTSDNLFFYRASLRDGLDDCETVFFDALVTDYCTVTQEGETEGVVGIRRTIQKVRDDLDEMGELIHIIDQSHINYRKRAVQRAQFLLLSDRSTQGNINELLRYYAQSIQCTSDLLEPDDLPLGQAIRVFPVNPLGESFLCTPTTSRKPTPITALAEVAPLSEEELLEEQRLLLQYAKMAVTEENVNQFAAKVLVREQAVHAMVLAEEYTEEFAKIIGLHTYSSSLHRRYEIELTENWVRSKGFRFQDFVVRKKV